VIVQPGGDPNGDFSVRIRGATSLEGQPPLLVIDGVAIDDFNKAINTLNPSDIESYDILKDASAAAIYGSRGANGVILVTTKRSRAGKTTVDYNGFLGLETISNSLDVLNADQYLTATGPDGAAFDKGGNTDWQKAISRTAFSQSHTIGISGGTSQFNFRGSLGYLHQDGVILNNFKDVITARLIAEQKSFKDKLEIRYGINTSIINRSFLPDQSSTNQPQQRGSDIFYGALHSLPVIPVYNPDGSYAGYYGDVPGGPVYTLKETYSRQRENFFQASLKADYELFRGLKIGVLGALSRGNDVYDFFDPRIPDFNQDPVASKANYNKQIFTGDIHASYRKVKDKHVFDLTGVYEYNQFINDGFSVKSRGFLVPDLLNNNLGAANNIQLGDASSYKNEVILKSILGRVVYSFDDRYILTVNFRRDGSSKFGPNNRWGNFPSFAFAWRASQEQFLAKVNWLDNLKLRVSYGLTGNQENLAPNPYQLLYGPVGPALYYGQVIQSYGVVQENNPDLKWEVRRSFNVGMDFSVLGNRLNGAIDVFSDKTSDMLYTYELPQPPFLFDRVIANAADATNKGFEITLSAGIIRNKHFQWDASFNLGAIENRVTNLSGQYQGANLYLTSEQQHYGYAFGSGFSYSYITQLQTGYPIGVFWLPVHAGLRPDGHELFNTYDTDGKLIGTDTVYTDKDRVYIDPTPKFAWGFTSTFTLGKIDLSIFLRGVQGQKIFANAQLSQDAMVYLPFNNVGVDALTNGFTQQPQPSTYWLYDGSFMRLENLTLGYNVNQWKGISRLRFFLSATNLFVLTSYEGIDPEVKTEGSQRYIDQNHYPKTRGFTFGVTVIF
jgi:iron complex outermembrane receptor protein